MSELGYIPTSGTPSGINDSLSTASIEDLMKRLIQLYDQHNIIIYKPAFGITEVNVDGMYSQFYGK